MFQSMRLQRRRPGAEAIILAGLFSAAFAYLAAWPHLLGAADESHFLYHAREILAGKAPYRDFFEFYTPLSFYLMALAFGLFGVKLATAKIFMALVHALTVGLIFKASRGAGARHSLAATAAMGYLVLGPPAWPYASPHWIASCLLAALLFLLTRRPFDRRTLLWLGLLTGALTSMQQQTGVPIAAGIGVAILAEARLEARAGRPASSRAVLERLSWFGAPAVLLTILILLLSMVRAGPTALLEQLLLHPLTGYRSNVQTSWGQVGLLTQWLAEFTFPRVLSVAAPVLLSICGLRMLAVWRARERGAHPALPILTSFLLFTVVAVLYYPDFIHLAFVSPVILVVSAETSEWGLRRLEALAPVPPLGLAIALPLSLISLVKMVDNYERLHARYNVRQETEFGRVDFSSVKGQQLFLEVDAELDRAPSRTLFCYPAQSALYLMAAADNPTRHILMFPKYLPKAEFDEAFAILDSLRVPNVVLLHAFLDPETDPMYAYVQRNYRCANDSKPCSIYRRKG